MDSDLFSTTIENWAIVLETASDVARFSFIVQDSISYLDLNVCENSRNSDYFRSLCDSCRARQFRSFVNTEEKCRKFFAPRRRLLYTLHLDLPRGREGSLKNPVPDSVDYHYSRCCGSPHIAEITLTCDFYANNLSNLIEDALRINIPKEKILKRMVKMNLSELPLFHCLEIRTASKFLDCFYPYVADSALFKDFIKQLDVYLWMAENEQPVILEFLLYHVRLLGNISLAEEDDCQFINNCAYHKHYLNIGPILKFISDSLPFSNSDFDSYLHILISQRPGLANDVVHMIDAAEESSPGERLCLVIQITTTYIDSRLPGLQAAVSEALRLIWSSIPAAYITFGELESVFGKSLSQEELTDVFDFYVKATGELHEHVEPRPLKHLCRTAIRRALQGNEVWIPDGISRTGLPKPLQSYLNLEETY